MQVSITSKSLALPVVVSRTSHVEMDGFLTSSVVCPATESSANLVCAQMATLRWSTLAVCAYSSSRPSAPRLEVNSTIEFHSFRSHVDSLSGLPGHTRHFDLATGETDKCRIASDEGCR